MFEKLVSNLPFNPSLIGDIAFYAGRLKREEMTRRLGVFFIIGALLLQSLAVFRPPQAANAANDSDMVRGGISSKADMMKHYRSKSNDIATILTYAGITEAELAASKVGSINSREHGTGANAWKSWGRVSKFSSSDGEVRHTIPYGDKATTVYSRPLWKFDSTSYTRQNGSSYKALIGTSKTRGAFTIIFNCGNLVTKTLPTPRLLNSIKANCSAITGTAIDERDRSKPVTVYLYFGGPPGKGKRSTAITTSSVNGSFSYPVDPSKDAGQKVWAVMKPLPGYPESSVGFRDTATITKDCAPKPLSVVCTSLALIAKASTVVMKATYKTSGDGKVDRAVIKVSGSTTLTREIANPSSPISYEFPSTTNASYRVDVEFYTSSKLVESTSCTKSITTKPGVCPYTESLTDTDPACKPCPGNSDLWVNDPGCQAAIVLAKSAVNITQNNGDATSTTALPGDKIAFTITAENTGATRDVIIIEDNIQDLLEYAVLDDASGGVVQDSTLKWPDVAVEGNTSVTRTFTATIKQTTATPQGISEPSSFDCVINNSVGVSTLQIPMNCPDVKMVEAAMTDLPATGPAENLLAIGGVSSVATYLLAYGRQKRRDLNRVRKAFDRGEL